MHIYPIAHNATHALPAAASASRERLPTPPARPGGRASAGLLRLQAIGGNTSASPAPTASSSSRSELSMSTIEPRRPRSALPMVPMAAAELVGDQRRSPCSGTMRANKIFMSTSHVCARESTRRAP